jgi:hypothetical protein
MTQQSLASDETRLNVFVLSRTLHYLNMAGLGKIFQDKTTSIMRVNWEITLSGMSSLNLQVFKSMNNNKWQSNLAPTGSHSIWHRRVSANNKTRGGKKFPLRSVT